MVSITADSAVQYFPSVLSENVSSMFIAAIKYFNFFLSITILHSDYISVPVAVDLHIYFFRKPNIYFFSIHPLQKTRFFINLSSSFEAEIKPGCPEFLHCEHIIIIFLVLCDCIYNDE